MTNFILSAPLLGFVVATRAALAFGMGLLVASRIPESRRRKIALTLIGIGAATTIPAARSVFAARDREHAANDQTEAEGPWCSGSL